DSLISSPYTTLFRSGKAHGAGFQLMPHAVAIKSKRGDLIGLLAKQDQAETITDTAFKKVTDHHLDRLQAIHASPGHAHVLGRHRSEEHTSELQSREN